MKKLFFLVAIINLVVFSGCKGEKSENKASEIQTEQKASIAVPQFSDAAITAGVKEWKTYMDTYIDAYKNKDYSKIQKLSGKAQEWATKTQEWATKMTSEDVEKWTDFSKKYLDELAKIMQSE